MSLDQNVQTTSGRGADVLATGEENS